MLIQLSWQGEEQCLSYTALLTANGGERLLQSQAMCSRLWQDCLPARRHPSVTLVAGSGADMWLWPWRWRTRAAWFWQPTIPTARPGSRAWSRALCRTSPQATHPPAGKAWGMGTGAVPWRVAGVGLGFCGLCVSPRAFPNCSATSWALCSCPFLASAGEVIQLSAAGRDWEGETGMLIWNLVSQQIRSVSCLRYSTRQSPGKKGTWIRLLLRSFRTITESEKTGMTESGAQKVDSGFGLEYYLIPSPLTHQVRTRPCLFVKLRLLLCTLSYTQRETASLKTV